jgi:hypothetical protein
MFAVLSLSCGALLLFLGRSLTFWFDDWDFVTFSGTGWDYFRPHNEHLIALPLALFRLTFAVVGLHSYLPYLVELVVLHLLTVAAAYVLMRRRVGPARAMLLSVPLLLLGSGSENLYWAFQATFVGSVLFGLWALVFVEQGGRRSLVMASLMLVASLMCSGMGIVMLIALVGRTLADPNLRTRTLVAVVPAVGYLGWYLALGNEGTESDSLAGPVALLRFVLRGVAQASAAVSGLSISPYARLLALALFIVLAYATARSRRKHALAFGSVVGVAALYVLTGVVRADLPTDYASRSRYVYVAAFLIAVAIADWLPTISGWFAREGRGRYLVAGLLILALVASVVVNVRDLRANRNEFLSRAGFTRAYVDLVLKHAGEPWIDTGAERVVPPAPRLLEAIAAHGSPLSDSLVPGVAVRPSPEAYEAALLRMIGHGFRVDPARPGRPATTSLTGANDLRVLDRQPCKVFLATGPDPEVGLDAPGGIRLHLTSSSHIEGVAALGRALPPTRYADLSLEPDEPVDVVVPDIGDGGHWRVRLVLPAAGGEVRVCPVRATIS